MLKVDLIKLWFLFRPLIDVLGTIAFIGLLSLGFKLLAIWFIKTFYKVILYSLIFMFIMVVLVIGCTMVFPELLLVLL